jgi:hypothetical protein
MDDVMKRTLFFLLIAISLPLNALAADVNKNFAAKGLALLPCANFVEERNKLSRAYGETMAWLTGFISAYNYLRPDTYDVAPWQSVELLSSVLAAHCAKNPKESFFHATDKLLNSISEDRLRANSEIVTISIGERKLNMYKDIIFRIQSALKDRGYLKVRWPTAEYDNSTIAAMKAFQSGNKLEATGVPDQRTLSLLFSK